MTRPCLWLRADAVSTIERYATRRAWLETGGALFGYWAGEAVVVVAATGPGSGRRRRRSFVADHDHTQRAIDHFFEQSGGAHHYLGSWHTHPTGPLAPSPRDLDTLQQMRRQPELILPRPVVVVVQPDAALARGQVSATTISDSGAPIPLDVAIDNAQT